MLRYLKNTFWYFVIYGIGALYVFLVGFDTDIKVYAFFAVPFVLYPVISWLRRKLKF